MKLQFATPALRAAEEHEAGSETFWPFGAWAANATVPELGVGLTLALTTSAEPL